jgi:hypothetical protein
MYELLCRNRVEDYTRWRKVFDSNAPAAREAGLQLTDLWRDIEDPNNIFFLFRVSSVDKARAFMQDPTAAESGVTAGVLDGEYHFVERGNAS